jgi:hypothetical protein
MRTYRGEWRYSSIVLDLSTRWRSLVSFTPMPLYSRGCRPSTHWIGGWMGFRAGLDVGNRTMAFQVVTRHYNDSISKTVTFIFPSISACLVWQTFPKKLLPRKKIGSWWNLLYTLLGLCWEFKFLLFLWPHDSLRWVVILHDLYLYRSFVRFDMFTRRSICCMKDTRSARCQTVTSLHLPLQRPGNSWHSQNEVITTKQRNTRAVLLTTTNENVLALSVWDIVQVLNKGKLS